jgi:hypothetical protein
MRSRPLTVSLACALLGSIAPLAPADEPAQPATPAAAPAAAAPAEAGAAAPAAPAPPTLAPALSGPIAGNAKPMSFDIGPLGPTYVTGVASYLGLLQNNVVPGDYRWASDLSNGQLFINKPTGVFQYFFQVGAYSIPALGTPYLHADTATKAFFGPFSQGYLKFAPTDSFSIQGGKLPTLIGAEYTFTFENMNIERGLLWNQENAVNRGIQVNYSIGPLALSASWNDGFYSNRFDWLWLSATWTIDKTDTLAAVGGGATSRTATNSLDTPVFQNNGQMYNLIYTRTQGQWTFEPYLQYTYVPTIPEIGSLKTASTFGAALLVNYSFPSDAKAGDLSLSGLSLPVRVEYITSNGSAANGSPNLLYGPGSKAWSVTITPTYQYNILFARFEFSVTGATSAANGFAFGPNGNDKTQVRGLFEGGLMF